MPLPVAEIDETGGPFGWRNIPLAVWGSAVSKSLVHGYILVLRAVRDVLARKLGLETDPGSVPIHCESNLNHDDRSQVH